MVVLSRSVSLVPVAWPVLILITIFTPYIIAVSLHHVYPFLPSISVAASFDPQGSLFGFLMTLVSFCGLMLIMTRYLQLEAIFSSHPLEQNVFKKVATWNKISLPFGFSCLFGVVLVATVRSSANVIIVVKGKLEPGPSLGGLHFAGSALLLASAVIYSWIQTVISFYTAKTGLHSKCVLIFRIIVSVIMTTTGISYPILKWFSYTMFTGSSLEYWQADDGGYTFHVLYTTGEWIACVCIGIYPASFYKEFQTFSVQISLVENKDVTSSSKSEYMKIKSNED